jgi:alpha-tubulin suppressor-like RCC1 family protein
VSAPATGEAGAVAVKNGYILASGRNIDQDPYSGGHVTAVGVGNEFAAALYSGAVTVWGQDPYGYGVLNVPPAAQQPGAIAAISVGRTHILALTTDGHVLAWGDNRLGETTPTIVRATAITAGDSVSFAVETNGSVFSWGDHSAAAVPPRAQSHVVSVAVDEDVVSDRRDEGDAGDRIGTRDRHHHAGLTDDARLTPQAAQRPRLKDHRARQSRAPAKNCLERGSSVSVPLLGGGSVAGLG